MNVPIYAVIIASVLFCIAGVVSAIKQENEEKAFLQMHHCQLQSEEATGRKVYCGKACYRDEIRRIYSCDIGTLVKLD